MASATPTASSLSRYRPIVLTVTGVAAAWTLYIIYNSLLAPTTPTLQRSNAVHRSRRSLREERLQQDSSEYGILELPGNHRIMLIAGHLPRAEFFRANLRYDEARAEHAARAAERLFLDTYLSRHVDERVPLELPVESHGWITEDGDTNRMYRRFEQWGIPQDAIHAAAQRHNDNIRRQIQADGAGGDSAPPAPRDNETEPPWQDFETHTATADVQDMQSGDGHALRRTLYYIAEDQARQKGIVHRGITCDGCSATPIRGIRWRCTNCVDFDLCSDCEATNIHPKTHMFQKVKIPARYLGYTRSPMPVYFPGNLQYLPSMVPNAARKNLEEATGYESEEIEGLWEQFTCLANVDWPEDPNRLQGAIDRHAFDRSFVPRYTNHIPAPNLIYDRVFAFFDSNSDGLIGFEEFVMGMNYIRMSPRIRAKLRKVFNCYDLDGDGFVSRRDFLRIFRANYAIQREKTKDMLAVHEEHFSVGAAMDTIQSGQPLSSVFLANPDFSRRRRGTTPRKRIDRFGDPDQNQTVVREDFPDTARRRDILNASTRQPSEAQQNSGISDVLANRWRQRDFYLDVQEGLNSNDLERDDDPWALHDQSTDGSRASWSTSYGETLNRPNESHPRLSHSRSSSRVRFADDPESDARSEASTSSRPINERWGGYGIPEAEKDLGKDILYQVTQEGINEMLDALFKRKEDLALEIKLTRDERRTWLREIHWFVQDTMRATGADFRRDPLLRSPEVEELMMVSMRFVSVITGKSWRACNALRTRGQPEEIGQMDGFVDEVFEPFEKALTRLETAGLGTDAYKSAVQAARSLISKAAKRLSDVRVQLPGALLDSKTDATMDTDNLDMQMDELVERSDHNQTETSPTSRTRAAAPNPPSMQTSQPADDSFDQAREDITTYASQDGLLQPPSEHHLNESDPIFPPSFTEELITDSNYSDTSFMANVTSLRHQNMPSPELLQQLVSSGRDPTMPQFRPNSDIPTEVSTPPRNQSSNSFPRRVSSLNSGTIHESSEQPTGSSDPAVPNLSAIPQEVRDFFAHIAARETTPEDIENIFTRKTEVDMIQRGTAAWYLDQAIKRGKDHSEPPSETRLARLAILNGVQDDDIQNGAGRLSFDEFEEKMAGKEGAMLLYIEGWLELGAL